MALTKPYCDLLGSLVGLYRPRHAVYLGEPEWDITEAIASKMGEGLLSSSLALHVVGRYQYDTPGALGFGRFASRAKKKYPFIIPTKTDILTFADILHPDARIDLFYLDYNNDGVVVDNFFATYAEFTHDGTIFLIEGGSVARDRIPQMAGREPLSPMIGWASLMYELNFFVYQVAPSLTILQKRLVAKEVIK